MPGFENPKGHDFTLQIPGLRIAGLAWGPIDGPRVLAVHGWLDNAASFSRLAPLLPHCRIIAIDLPGHGLSDHVPAGLAYHFIDWVRILASVVDALGWQRFHFLGHSMGAAAGSLFGGTFPDRLASLVLLDALGPMTEEPEVAPLRMASGIRALLGADPPRALRVFSDYDAAAARFCLASPGLTMLGARRIVERGMKPVSGGFVWRSDPRMRVPSLLRLTEPHVAAFFQRTACPVLVVRATHGWPFDPLWAARLIGCVPRAWAIEVGGGHHVHLDAPERVFPAVAAMVGLASG